MRTSVAMVVIGSVAVGACATEDAERTTTSVEAPVATSAPPAPTSGDDGVGNEPSAPVTAGPPPVDASTTVPNEDAAPAVTPAELDPVAEEGREHVADFLDHLAAGRYADAATMLGHEGADGARRSDLAVLGDALERDVVLETTLADWCGVARCEAPSDLSARADEEGLGAVVTAIWGDDDALVSATFQVQTLEGLPAVRGLPPVTGAPALAVTAEVVGATTVVAEPPGSGVVSWIDGGVFEVSARDDVFAWSDGAFVYWSEWHTDADDGASSETSFAVTLDGQPICEVPGRIHRLRETDEGTFVASVERDDQPPPGDSAEWPIPNFAIRCETGEETPIEPVSFRREGGGRSTQVVAGRTFTSIWDAEGNADVVNERNVSVNGDDYAGWHVFSPDAGLVVYGDYGVSASPHETNTIRVRETVDGAERWSTELERSFNRLIVTDDRVIVGLPPERVGYEFWSATESIAVFDLQTGVRLATIPTDADLLFVG